MSRYKALASGSKVVAGRSLLAALGCCVWVALAASPASALTTHVFSSSFATQGPGAGQVSSPQALAVNDATGDIYVADTGNDRVDEFDSSGTFIRAWGWGVADGGSSFETCTTTCQAGVSGSGAGQFTTPAFIAVDNSRGASAGDVYVGDPGDDVVTKFTAAGVLVTGWATGGQLNGSTATNGPFGPLAGVTVDGSGNLWVYDTNSEMFEFAQDASFTQDWNSGRGVTAAGIDADSAGNLYVLTGGGSVEQFSSTGTDVGPVNGDVSSPTGFAVDRSNNGVYMDNSGALIYHYPASCDAGGSCTAADTFGSGDLSSAAGLAVDTSDHTVYAADAGDQRIDVFTAVTLPDVSTAQASSVTTTSATLNGTVNPDATTITDCHFDYVDDADYNPSAPNPYSAGATAPCSNTLTGSSPVAVSADVSGLSPSTLYHFRLEATNSGGTTDGSDQTFTTPGPPSVDGESAAAVISGASASSDEETLSTQINPHGLDTTYHFEYGTADCATSACTSVPVPDADIGSQSTDQTVTQTITGLSAGTTYHYRVVATNSAGALVDGPDQTFTINGFGFQPGTAGFDVAITNQDGSPDTQAGSHPYEMTVNVALNSNSDAGGNAYPAGGNVRDIDVDLPAGLIGDPNSTPQCTLQQLEESITLSGCPGDSQIGNSTITGEGRISLTFPVYNMVPPPGVPARFAFGINGVDAFIDAGVRTGGDYGITEDISNISDRTILSDSLTIWGVPADPSHDSQRTCDARLGCSSGAAVEPLLTLPTSCGAPLTFSAHADAWQNPGITASTSFVTSAIAGCSQLDFSPSISVQPDTTVADSPSGLSVDVHVPQDGLTNPTGLAEANLDDATVTLPAGVSVNPSAANGLAACTPQEIGIDNANEPSCPDASKIGSVEVDTPLLTVPLTGGIYFAQQTQNPFGSLLAIYVTAEADGVLVKLAGHVVADPVTGQLTTTFSNNPQLPFTDFKLNFFGGPEGVLATPDACGTYTTSSSFTPWSGTPPVSSLDSFTISSGCVSGFAPSFTAGTSNPQAGAFSPFTLSFSRADTDQNLSGLSVTLPPGMLAKLAGVQECSEAALASISSQPGTGTAQAANPSCPAGSQVGTVETGAGTGSDPFFLPGRVYLTGPYKGAPYGLAVVVPALAGPLDLGTVVVRQALYIDPTTAQVTAVSDPFPTILDGIPLRIQRIDVSLNRPDFTVNPTSCDPMAITGTLTSIAGLSSPVSSRFQVGGCQELAFSPKLKMALTGKGKTRSGDHPSLVSTLTQPFGQANIHNVKVTLPLSMALDPNNSQHVCNYDVALAVHGGAVGCPASTIVGSASAVTPLLSQPLSGKVYLVQGIRFSHGNRIRTLPSLLIPLRGQIALDLRAKTSVNAGSALVTTFSTIPDAAVSKFTLTIAGGKKGLLVITGLGRSICTAAQTTKATLGAQSGKTQNNSIRMSTPCSRITKTKKGKKHTRT